MTRTFEIEWPDELGDSWMNIWNLLICLTETCPYTKFTATDVTGDVPKFSASSGPKLGKD